MQNNIFTFFIAGTLGILLHLFAVKIPSLRDKAHAANTTFSFEAYIKEDWIALVANFLTLIILIFLWNEIVGLYNNAAKYARWLFVFVGFTGSSIILALLSATNKRIMNIIDYKTDKADGVLKPNKSYGSATPPKE